MHNNYGWLEACCSRVFPKLVFYVWTYPTSTNMCVTTCKVFTLWARSLHMLYTLFFYMRNNSWVRKCNGPTCYQHIDLPVFSNWFNNTQPAILVLKSFVCSLTFHTIPPLQKMWLYFGIVNVHVDAVVLFKDTYIHDCMHLLRECNPTYRGLQNGV